MPHSEDYPTLLDNLVAEFCWSHRLIVGDACGRWDAICPVVHNVRFGPRVHRGLADRSRENSGLSVVPRWIGRLATRGR